ncbi:MAG TPA: dual specificity protein phosphatase family protein [Anaeromyxobacter sp.]|nr:dual specificity protein phosphatase family protein [Anaeromyxobacter sp.]
MSSVVDLHFIAPGLAVGSRFPMEAAARLAAEHGISRVVDVRVEACDDEAVLRTHGIRLLHLPTEDTCAIVQERIRHGVAFVNEGLDRGEKVLVHCQHGIGRSALLAVCVLVSRGDPPLVALERAKRARRVVSPSPEQLRAIASYAAKVRAERRAAWDVPTVKELGVIAWRHLLHEEEDVSEDDARASSTRAS